MMINNGGSYYPPPYGSTIFSGIPNNYGIGQSVIPTYYNSAFQPHPINQQNTENPPPPPPPSFKLYDLDPNTHTEIIRLIFSYAGISFKDKRIKEDEWNKIKDQMSFEELPILRVNNQFRIYHLHAIIHYLAREFHLYGTGKHDHAVVDIILETIRPLQEKIFEQSKNSEENSHALLIDSSTIYLKQLEKCYEIFHHHGPFYLGSQISLADLIVYDTINYLIKIDRKLLENYSHLKEARRRLEKNPRIINYINTKTYQQIKKSPPSPRHRTKSPTPNLTSHHHRHRSHDEHRLHHRHHHHHHHRRHSKEPTPFSQTKRSIRSSKSPSVAKKEKESTDAIPSSSPPITTEEKSESTVH